MTKASLAAALFLCATPALAAAPLSCPPAAGTEAAEAVALPHVAAMLKPGATLDILAIGAGPDKQAGLAATPTATPGFFSQLTRILESSQRGLHAAVTVRGGRGLLAPAQLDLIRAALAQHRYQLVLWQTGTIDAVQAEPLEDFSTALADGADAANEAGADLILVEPQYSRFLEANTDLWPYLSAMSALGAEPGSTVFHRYAIMHDWVTSGFVDLEYAPPSERMAAAARLHGCLAAALGRQILEQADAAASAK